MALCSVARIRTLSPTERVQGPTRSSDEASDGPSSSQLFMRASAPRCPVKIGMKCNPINLSGDKSFEDVIEEIKDERMGDLIASLLEEAEAEDAAQVAAPGVEPDAAAIATGPLDPIFPAGLVSSSSLGTASTTTVSTQDMPPLEPRVGPHPWSPEEPASPMCSPEAPTHSPSSPSHSPPHSPTHSAAEEEPEPVAAPGVEPGAADNSKHYLMEDGYRRSLSRRRVVSLLHRATKSAWSNLVLENERGFVHKHAISKLLPHPDDEDSYSKTCPAGHNYPPITEFKVRAGSHLWGESACFCLEFKLKYDRISRATGKSKPSLQWLGTSSCNPVRDFEVWGKEHNVYFEFPYDDARLRGGNNNNQANITRKRKKQTTRRENKKKHTTSTSTGPQNRGDPAGDGPNPSGHAPSSTEEKQSAPEPPDLPKHFAFPQLFAPHQLPPGAPQDGRIGTCRHLPCLLPVCPPETCGSCDMCQLNSSLTSSTS